jgi:hypothetical protein
VVSSVVWYDVPTKSYEIHQICLWEADVRTEHTEWLNHKNGVLMK